MTAPTLFPALVGEWASSPFQPYAYYDDLHEERLQDYFRDVVQSAMRRPGVRTWNLRRSGRWLGLAQLEPLEWDSRMLGRAAARLNWLLAPGDYPAALERKQQLLDWVLDEARRQGVEYLTARVPADDLSSLHALESRGFLLLDVILTFSRTLSDVPTCPSDRGVRLCRPTDVPALRRIAESSFRYDRYHADPIIPAGVADRLHAEWIENSARGFADAVLVADGDSCSNEPAGFLTLKLDRKAGPLLGVSIATIVLVATAAHARGAGIGRRLVQAALEWCREQQVDHLEVGTQVRNAPASRLYTTEGFRQVQTSVSLRHAP